MNAAKTYDVVILGSGFGGSLTAAILGQAGLSVAVVDPQRHPRFAIGESSTPAADLILHDLAVRYHLPELLPLTCFGQWRESYPDLLCGCKRGFSYFWHADAGGFRPTPDHRHELLVAANASKEVADTQWYRPDVDSFLAQLAASRNAELFEATTVTAIDHPKPRQWMLTLDRGGIPQTLQTEFVIDASGAAGRLMRQLNLQDETAKLETNSAAVYGHWRELPLLQDWLTEQGVSTADYPFPCDDAALHHLFADGWAWQLRFSDGRVSLGSVFTPATHLEGSLSAEELLTWNRPFLKEYLKSATPAEFPGQLFRTGRMQRLWSQAAGEDWAALPFTAGFIDPLHSTGIAQTLSAIEKLAQILLIPPTAERSAALDDYSQKILTELLLIDRLVAGCYLGLCDFPLFTAWSMLYFAAATSFEKARTADPNRNVDFLLADDPAFVETVHGLYRRLEQLRQTSSPPAEQSVQQFEQEVRQAIEPYNHVGLFAPEVPNMYRYTAAAK